MKKIVTSKLVLAILVIAISFSLVGCAPTEAEKAADACLRGNEAACKYHAALLKFEAEEAAFKEAEKAFEKAEAAKDQAKKAYEASLKPSPTVTPTVTEKPLFSPDRDPTK